MVGRALLAAIRAFDMGGWRQPMVRTPHVAPRRRLFSFWDRHGDAAPFKSAELAGTARRRDRPVGGETGPPNPNRVPDFRGAMAAGFPAYWAFLQRFSAANGLSPGPSKDPEAIRPPGHPALAGVGIDRKRKFLKAVGHKIVMAVLYFLRTFVRTGRDIVNGRWQPRDVSRQVQGTRNSKYQMRMPPLPVSPHSSVRYVGVKVRLHKKLTRPSAYEDNGAVKFFHGFEFCPFGQSALAVLP